MELRDVAAIDLSQRRIAYAFGAAAVSGPVAFTVGLLCGGEQRTNEAGKRQFHRRRCYQVRVSPRRREESLNSRSLRTISTTRGNIGEAGSPAEPAEPNTIRLAGCHPA